MYDSLGWHWNFFLEAPTKQCQRQFADANALINYRHIARTPNFWIYIEPLSIDADDPGRFALSI